MRIIYVAAAEKIELVMFSSEEFVYIDGELIFIGTNVSLYKGKR